MDIKENIEIILSNMREACRKSGRDMSDITLVGVTKTVDAVKINELAGLGIRDIGENRVQEILAKYPYIDSNVNWHLIGHLQTNKVKYVIDKVKLIHSADSIKLIHEIDRQASLIGKTADALVEINIAGEKTKYGIRTSELDSFLDEAASCSNVRIKGLMCVAPHIAKNGDNRRFFREMRCLFNKVRSKNFNTNIEMRHLSMGMTDDYKEAIEEGADIIRIGTGIFGERNSSYRR